MALTDDNRELHQMDTPSQIGCHQVKVVDTVRAQQEDPHIGRVLQVVKTSHKPTVGQKQKEPPLDRKLLNKWHKLHVDKKSGILYHNQKIVLPQKLRRTVYRELHEEMGHLGVERLLALARERFYWPHEEGYRRLYPSYVPLSETETPKFINKRAFTANCHNSTSSNAVH